MFTRQAFEHLVGAFSAELYHYVYWRCGNQTLAEDLVQETFARAWKSRAQLQDPHAAKPWLYRILRNEHARCYERKQLDLDERELQDLPIADGADGADLARDHAINECIALLASQYREPLLMQVLGGYTCAEIATRLGISETAIMQRLYRARQGFRRLWLGETSPARKTRACLR